MNKHFLHTMHDKITEIKREQQHLVQSLEAERDETLTESLGELSSLDQHASDLGTELNERQKEQGFIQQAEYTIQQCDEALDKMQQGTYGLCERCNVPIDRERLISQPFASRCMPCQMKEEEENENVPNEYVARQDVRTAALQHELADDDDESAEQLTIGDDDAWEIVSRYGTSNAPQDRARTVEEDDPENVLPQD